MDGPRNLELSTKMNDDFHAITKEIFLSNLVQLNWS